GVSRLVLIEPLTVASLSGLTWTAATDTYQGLAALTDLANIKVANRFFEPTGALMSLTNADRLGNWQAFTAAGARDDAMLNATGFVGRIKGTAVCATT